MLSFSIIFLFVVICIFDCFTQISAAANSDNETDTNVPIAQWFEQHLDHFNYAETRTWKQRYFVNDSFYSPESEGPIFVQISGEGASNPITAVEGQWINWAQEFGALCFQLEHRYYGESHPTEDLSVENLQYLSSDQALADLALFRNAMAEKYGIAEGSKWIFFGGSYSGSLAAWMRLKYPNLVDGAVASSAPVHAVLDFSSYFGVVDSAIAQVSNSCNSAISKAVHQIERALKTENGCDEVTELFRLCSSLNVTIEDDVMSFYESLATNFATVVQYNNDNRAYEGSNFANITIETICSIMNNQSIGPEINRYAAVNSLMLDRSDENCLDYDYNSSISCFRNSSWDGTDSDGGRQWTYQVCTEFGYLQASNFTGQPYGYFPLSFQVQQCADIFGPAFNYEMLTNGIKQTNINYGGTDIQVTKVIFPNGSNDPWHILGVLKDINPEAKALLIQGTAHCADMYPDAPWDPPQLIKARQIIKNQIEEWIS